MEKNTYICTMKSLQRDRHIDEGVLLLSVSGNLVNFKKDVDRQSLSSLGISTRFSFRRKYTSVGYCLYVQRFYQSRQRYKQVAPHFLYNLKLISQTYWSKGGEKETMMKLIKLVEDVKAMYQEKNISSCRYNALDKVVAFLEVNSPEITQDISLLKKIDKKQLKNDYEQSKGCKINGAENQAINDLYNILT